MTQSALTSRKHVVALFNASDDTVEMVQRMLGASGFDCLVGCRFADLKKGRIDFTRYLDQHQPDVVIVDISPPYAENWEFFKTLRDVKAMKGRGLVLTTTNKDPLQFFRGLRAQQNNDKTANLPPDTLDRSVDAQSLLDHAAHLESIDRSKAIAKYREVITLFPGTPASVEAERNIEILSSHKS